MLLYQSYYKYYIHINLKLALLKQTTREKKESSHMLWKRGEEKTIVMRM